MPCYFPWYKDTIPLPCGKCPYCLQRRANNWIFRCMQENRVADYSYFVTLTYEQPPLTKTNQMTVDKTDVQKFFKRLRKYDHESFKPIKYYLCAEYGDTYERPHYHAIIFNAKAQHIQSAWQGYRPVDDFNRSLGNVKLDIVNEKTIAYTAKYMNKGKLIPKHKNDDRTPEFQLFSKKLGINFITNAVRTFYSSDPTRNSVSVDGFKKALPRYFADKLIVCPVFRLAKRLYIQDKADILLAEQREEFRQNPTYHQTFEAFREEKKRNAVQQFRDKLKKRNKFR